MQFWLMGAPQGSNILDYKTFSNLNLPVKSEFSTRGFRKCSGVASPEYFLLRTDQAYEASQKVYPNFTNSFIKVDGYSPQKYLADEMVYKIDCHLEPSLIRYPLVFATTYDDSVFKLAFSCYVGEFISGEFKHYFLFATLRVHGTKDTKTEVIDDFVESIDKIYG